MTSDETLEANYKRLIRFVFKRHQRLFPTHNVGADDLAVHCNTCHKGIGVETDGPPPDTVTKS